MLALLVTFPRRRIAATGMPSPPVVLAIFVGVGSAALLAMIVLVIGNFEHKAAAYIAALTINFFTLAFAFIVALEVILRQPSDVQKPE
jgi:hypothetical protein